MDRIIEVAVKGNYLTKDSSRAGVQHESNATALRITFDEAWDGLAKTVTWWDASGHNPTACLLTADLNSPRVYLHEIPHEAMYAAGWCRFVIDGTAGDVRKRVAMAELLVEPSDIAVPSTDVTPTEAAALQAEIEGLLGAVSGEADKAGESAINALSAQDAAYEAQGAAQAARNEARISEINAEVWAEGGTLVAHAGGAALQVVNPGAKGYAELASQHADNANDSAGDAKKSASEAAAGASEAKSYAVGGTGVRDGEGADNAKYYAEEAKRRETAARLYATDAKSSALRYPYIGENGNWFVWGNVEEETPGDPVKPIDTGIPATGTNGVGIKRVEQTVTSTEDGGVNQVAIETTDGWVQLVEIRNGSKGSDGEDGVDGKDYVLTDADKEEIAGSASPYKCYASLSAAITDINNGVCSGALPSQTGATVRVHTADSGRVVVTLLDNVSQGTALNVSKSIDLVLNGKTLTFSGASATLTFAADTDCTIDGRVAGSTICLTDFNSTASSASAIIINGRSLHLIGGKYTIYGSCSGTWAVIKAVAACEMLTLDGCTLDVKNTHATTTKYTRVFQSQAAEMIAKGCTIAVDCEMKAQIYFGIGEATFEDCTINSVGGNIAIGLWNAAGGVLRALRTKVVADAPGDNANEEYAQGITNEGICHLTDCEVFGTLAGVGNEGELYVNGGTYTGYSHGGLYFGHDENGVAYVNDALIRCGNYEGIYEEVFAGDTVEPYGGFYVGGDAAACNMEVYIDGCTIDASMVSADREGNGAFCIRVAAGETGNTVNISNSVIVEGSPRIRVEDSHHLNVGIGTNITTDMLGEPSRASFTDKLYRKKHPSAALNGNDFAALASFFAAQS